MARLVTSSSVRWLKMVRAMCRLRQRRPSERFLPSALFLLSQVWLGPASAGLSPYRESHAHASLATDSPVQEPQFPGPGDRLMTGGEPPASGKSTSPAT